MLTTKRTTGKHSRAKRKSGLAILIRRATGLPMEEALMRANREAVVIASNQRLGDSLLTDEWRQVADAFPCWTGTMVAYEEPDKGLGRAITFTDSKTGKEYVFPVPREHRGRKNIALAAEHPDFSLQPRGSGVTVLTSKAAVIENFPAENGWYVGDLVYGIPQGPPVSPTRQAARKLWRNEGAMVGLVVREAGGADTNSHIGLRSRPSYTDLGVIIDVSKGGMPKSETKITADGVLLAGLSVGQFTGLLAEAQADYEHLRADVPAHALEGIRRLLDALRLK